MVGMGCNNDQYNNLMNTGLNSTAKSKLMPAIDTIFARDRDTLILLKKGEAFIKGQISSHRPQPKYTLPVWKGQTVTAVLTPLKNNGNVRIHQVLKPGGEVDGPFFEQIRDKIESHGNLQYIINESSTAGNFDKTDFILHIKVN